MIRNIDPATGDLAEQSTPFLYSQAFVGASIRHRLMMFFGEFFLDISDGTPWFQSVLGKTPQDTAEFAIKQRIVTAPGVVQITRLNFDFDRDSRRIRVDCAVLSVYNEVISVLFDESLSLPPGGKKPFVEPTMDPPGNLTVEVA